MVEAYIRDEQGRVIEGDHASGVWVEQRKIASIGVRCALC